MPAQQHSFPHSVIHIKMAEAAAAWEAPSLSTASADEQPWHKDAVNQSISRRQGQGEKPSYMSPHYYEQ